jgi:hypothetical protein
MISSRLASSVWLLSSVLLLSPLVAAETRDSTAGLTADQVVKIKLFNGLEYSGIVQKDSTDDTLSLLTSYGPLSFRRTDVLRTHTDLSDSEKNIIRVAVRDADAQKRSLETQRSAVPEIRRVAELPKVRAASDDTRETQRAAARQYLAGTTTWAERMDRNLGKKLTISLENDSLKDVIQLITSITNLNIIVDPKVLAANPVVTLNVTEMDAGTVLKWVTKLTDTYAEVKDQAIWITDKPSKENDDSEKMEAIMLAMRVGAQIDLPADGSPLTDDDRLKIAQKIIEKEMPKPPDFPGPDIGIGVHDNNATPFGNR